MPDLEEHQQKMEILEAHRVELMRQQADARSRGDEGRAADLDRAIEINMEAQKFEITMFAQGPRHD